MTACHVCGGDRLELQAGYERRRRVASDCKPWPAGGKLATCAACGVVQKPADDVWSDECRRIYGAYTIYSQTGGAEQVVFGAAGQRSPRSLLLLERARAAAALPAQGRLLDVGCGSGAFLRAFHQVFPGWALAGSDLSDRERAQVEAIEGVEALHVGPPDEVRSTFDLISFSHSLEHIPSPVGLLERLHARLRPGGHMLVELPDHRQNPVDLVVADHASHFSSDTLRAVVEAAGYQVVALADDWIPRELTLLARPCPRRVELGGRAAQSGAVGAALDWLGAVARAASEAAAQGGTFGIFGSSVGAAWLFGEVGERAELFVDEDPGRAGRTFLGRPILPPSQVPPGTVVYAALAPPQAVALRDRLASAGVALRLLVPPPLRAP